MDGTNLRTILPNWDCNYGFHIWSKDGTEVIAERSVAGVQQLVAVSVRPPFNVRVLVPNFGGDVWKLSPDGNKLGIHAGPYGSGRREIVDLNTLTRSVVDTETGSVDLMMNNCDSSHCWSPDSSTYFYTRYNSAQQGSIYSYAGSGPPALVHDTGGRLTWVRVAAPRKMAYVIMGAGIRVYYMDDYTDASTRRLLGSRATGSYWSGAPDIVEFSPDGNRLYWMQGKGAGSNFQVYRLGGSAPAQVLAPSGTVANWGRNNIFQVTAP
jgi:hypothetical protein